MIMKHALHESMSTTSGQFSRQLVEMRIAHPGSFSMLCCASGGALDAPDYMAAGGCNSTQFKNGAGKAMPRQSLTQREVP